MTDVNAIGRIRDFALAGTDGPPRSLGQGVATLATSFDSSRAPRLKRRPPAREAQNALADPSEQEMCRLVRPHGFVVRIDYQAGQPNERTLKLFRFADRRVPAATFTNFTDLVEWLALS
jgi:hypothetical protein